MTDGTPNPKDIPENTASESTSRPGDEAGAGLFAEKERIDRLSRIRQFVFGSLDGLLVPLGVISGVAGGTGSTKAVIVAGLAEAFAGALSMGAGEFISGHSEAQVNQTEIAKELAEIKSMPEYEAHEMALLFAHEGVASEDATKLADILTRYPEAYHKTMVEKELGLQMEVSAVKVPEALTMSGSYLVGSIFPLIAYFFLPIPQALPVSLVLTVIALIIVGYIKGRLASLNLVVSIVEVVIVGSSSALGGYLLGTVIPRLFGF
jgi:vacuolar iron transporter family protein